MKDGLGMDGMFGGLVLLDWKGFQGESSDVGAQPMVERGDESGRRGSGCWRMLDIAVNNIWHRGQSMEGLVMITNT